MLEPYHRLARTPKYRWWNPIVEIVVFVLLVFGLWLAIIPALYELVGPAEDGAPGIIKLALTIAVAMPAAMIAGRIMGRRWGALLSVEGRLRGRWFVTCLCVALAFVVVILAIYVLVDRAGYALGPPRGAWIGLSAFLPLAITVLVVIPLQAAAEELAFRGTLMQAVGAWAPWRWLPIVVSTLLFALAHGLTIEGFVAIAGFGAVAAWLTIRTGGLEAAIALHVVNNVGLFLLDAATGRADTWITQLNTDISWGATAVDVASNVLYGVVIAKLFATASRAP